MDYFDSREYEHMTEEQYLHNKYLHDKVDVCNLSFWYPEVKNCGFATPETFMIPVPFEMYYIIEGDHLCEPKTYKPVVDFVNDTIVPRFRMLTAGKPPICFCKNGTYSGKYDAHICFSNEFRLVDSFMTICYQAAVANAGGNTEFVLREAILHNSKETPCIYNGLPLRSEVRVFYNFDTHNVLYSVNYWKYDHVMRHLRDKSDIIVFQHERDRLQAEFEKNKPIAEEKVQKYFANVSGLHGKWSADLMFCEDGSCYLIDMAKAERSAFWYFDRSKWNDVCT